MNERTRNRVWKWSLIGLFGVGALALPAGGYWLYRHQTQAIRSEKQSELKTIAELKAGQIANWRSERVGDARVHSRRAFFRCAVGRWLTASGDASLRTEAEENMESIRTSYGYENVIVAGRDGRILFSLNPRLTVLDASAKQLVAQAISSRDPVFGDLFRRSTCNEVHLDVAAAILDPDKRPAAVLILRTDAEQFLYPFVQSWPTPSRSAETLLVRRDGDDALFLNKLRFRPDPALTLRVPLSGSDIPAVRAALGKTGAFEGRDNRGVKVLAEILRVPGSPWFMVAKVDADEILAEARYRGQYILLFTVLCVLATGAMAAFVFNFRQRILYQNLYLAERQRRQVEEEIHAAFYSIGDGVISTDAAGRVTRMNPVAEQLTGWSETEVLGKPVEQVFHIVNEESRVKVENPVVRVMHDGMVVNLANHTLLIARDGTERPIADSGSPIRNEQGQVTGVVLVFRDQTDERRAEAKLKDARALWDSALSSITDVFYVFDVSGNFLVWNATFARVTGYSDQELSSKQPTDFFSGQDIQRISEAIERIWKDGTSQQDAMFVLKDGTQLPYEFTGSILRDGAGDIIGFSGTGRDLTERKRTEKRSKLDEARVSALLELSQMTDRSAAEIANYAMESAIKLTGSTIGYIAFANEDETVLTMHYWSSSAMQQCAMIDKPIVYPVKDTGLWGEAIRQRKAVITNDYAAPNPLKKGTPSGHVPLTRHMNIPVFDGGRIVAVAGVGNKADDYQDDDVGQLTLFMDGMWRILCRKQAEEALKQFNQQLESAALQVKALMNDVIHKRIFTNRFENPSLSPCWEAKKCDNTACPSYRNHENLRCWEVAGTLCCGKVQATVRAETRRLQPLRCLPACSDQPGHGLGRDVQHDDRHPR